MEQKFLDNFDDNGFSQICSLVADYLLGTDQQDLILRRYNDLQLNFNNVTEDGKKKYPHCNEWKFSDGLMPYNNYKDTTSVPIPITHHYFQSIRGEYMERNGKEGGAAMGIDMPTWFNLAHSKWRIMIVAQDPLRNPKWYKDCPHAICSSPFGLHSYEWRLNGRGGKRLYNLIEKLTTEDCGVYLTDIFKLYIKGEGKAKKPYSFKNEHYERFAEILSREITIVNPDIIVAMGKKASKALNEISRFCKDLPEIIEMPHFSGSAQGAIKAYFREDGKLDVDRQVELYLNKIFEHINK